MGGDIAHESKQNMQNMLGKYALEVMLGPASTGAVQDELLLRVDRLAESFARLDKHTS